MTASEIRAIELEISRLEELQADSILDKKTAYAKRNHDKILKLKRLLGR